MALNSLFVLKLPLNPNQPTIVSEMCYDHLFRNVLALLHSLNSLLFLAVPSFTVLVEFIRTEKLNVHPRKSNTNGFIHVINFINA